MWNIDLFDPPTQGYTRKWLQCKTCENVYYYDYVPYSLSNPIMWLPCHHNAPGRQLHDSVNELTAEQARDFFGSYEDYQI